MTEPLHGGDRYGRGEVVDFSANISPLGLPQGVKEALSASLENWDAYPDPICRDLTAAIAAQNGLPAETVCCGNGAVELLFCTVAALRARRALLPIPSFAEYERALRAVDCKITFYSLLEQEQFALTDRLLGQLDQEIDLLILCNPNNPTGKTVDPLLMHQILKTCKQQGITLIVDECFVDFLEHPQTHQLTGYLAEYPNLILLRAFTKLYAMAGLRLGYLLSANQLFIKKLQESTPPWSVSAPAQTAGMAALEEIDYVANVRKLIHAGRIQLSEGLDRLKLTVFASEANFLFFRAPVNCSLKQKLLTQGILIRSCENFAGLDDRFYRVCIRRQEENEQLLKALKIALGGS